MYTFDQARQLVQKRWPEYQVAARGYDGGDDWILLLLPETIGGRIPLVSKATGALSWINENSDRYDQSRPVGDWTQNDGGGASDALKIVDSTLPSG